MKGKNILIIGFGRMGFAYASSFLSFPGYMRLFIFDIDIKNGKKRFSDQNVAPNVVVTWLEDLQDLIDSDISIDLCVNSASLQARWTYHNILEQVKIRRMLFEKPLLSRNYKAELAQITATNVFDARVNFSRRMSSGFADLKKKCHGGIRSITVVGENLSMGSNWSHFVDLFYWLTESHLDKIEFDISWVSPVNSVYRIVEGRFQGCADGEVGINFESSYKPGVRKRYTSVIHLMNGDRIEYREVFGTQAFGPAGAFEVNIPFTSDTDFTPMISGPNTDSAISLPRISEVLGFVSLGTESFYSALDSAGYDQVEVT